MPEFTTERLGEANTGFLTPVVDKPATAGFDTLMSIGNMAVDVTKKAAVMGVQQGMEQLKSDYEAQDVPSYTQEEIAAVDDFGKQIAMMRDAAAQRNRNSEFRVRAEALLKEKMAAMPGLQEEFRRAASGTLGFDPYGEGLRQKMAAVEDSAALAEKKLLQIEDTAVNKYKMAPGSVYTQEGQAQFQHYSQIENKIYELTQLKELDALLNPKGDKASLEQGKYNIVSQYFNNSNTIRQGSTQLAWGTLNEVVSDALGEPVDARTQLDVGKLSRLTAEQKKEIRYALAEAKRGYQQPSFSDRAAFSTDQWKDFSEQAYGPFDAALAALDDEKALEALKLDYELQGAAVTQGIANTPAFKKTQALKSIGFQPSALLQAKMGEQLLDQISGALLTPEGKTPVVPDKVDKKQAKAAADALSQTLMTNDQITPEIKNVVLNYAQILSDGGSSYDKESVRALIGGLNNPSTVESVRQALSSDPYVGRQASRAIVTHGQKLARTASVKVEGFDKAVVGGEKVAPFTIVEQDGKLVVQFNEEAMNALEEGYRQSREFSGLAAGGMYDTNTVLLPPNRNDLRQIEQGYVAPLNEAVDALVNLFGVSREDAVKRVLEGTPFAVSEEDK